VAAPHRVPAGHPLAAEREVSLKRWARFPIVTYTFSFGAAPAAGAVRSAGLKLNVALTASDADVIKTYVRLGLGVGIVASMAIDPAEDEDLVGARCAAPVRAARDLDRFPARPAAARLHVRVPEVFRAHLNRRLVDQAIRAGSGEELARLFADVELPIR